MRWLIDSSIRFKGLVIAGAVALIVFGGVQLAGAPLDTLPEFTPTLVEVQTEALGLSAEEVEQFITVPLEQDLLNGVAFIEDIESASLPGLSSIVITFEPGTDLLDARQVVAERLTQAVGVAGLPNVANPPQMLQPLSSTNRVAIVRLTPQDLDAIQTSVLARWVIGPRLLGVEGVANVSIFGQRERQLQVRVDPERLAMSGVSLSDVVRTTGNALEVSPLSFLEASKPGTGGFIDTVNQRFQVFHEQTIETAGELGQVPLEDGDGNPVFSNGAAITLAEVADVVEDHQPLIGDALCGGGQCLLLVIEKFPGTDTVTVAASIDEAIDVMRPGLEGIGIDSSIYRPVDYIEASFFSLQFAVLIGALLAIAALVAFLLHWRSILLIVVVMTTSLAAAVAVLVVRGEPLNVMLLAGLVLGLLVVIDDAVVDVGQLAGRVHAMDDRGDIPVGRRIRFVIMETRSASLYSLIILGAVVAPAFFLQGIEGAFLPTILSSYLLAVVVSLLVALTLTPAMAATILDGDSVPPAVAAIRRFFDSVLAKRTARVVPAAVVVIALTTVGVVAAAVTRPAFDPSLQELDIVVELEAAPGTSLQSMREATQRMVDSVSGISGVRGSGATVGRAITSDQITNVNRAELWVNLDRTADYDRAVTLIEQAVSGDPELAAVVTTHSQQRIDEILNRTEKDLVVRVYGEDVGILESKAAEIEGRLAGIDGVVDLTIERVPEETAIKVSTDLVPAQAVGLKPGDIRRQAAILLNGITVGNLFDEQKVFDVVVWGVPELRESVEAVENLPVETERFGRIPLGSVATVDISPSPAVIFHESVFAYLDVSANVSGRSATAVAAEIESVIDGVDFPLEHHAELLGSYDERQTQRWLMIGLWTAAAVFVFLLLQSALNSWKLAAAASAALAPAVSGGLAAVLVTGRTLSLGSAAGLFVVFGLAVRQILLMIRHFQRLQRDHGLPFDLDLVVRGARDRLAPMVTSTVAGIFLLVPIAIRGPSAGFEILQPMSVVVIGGMIAIGLVGVFVLPAIYLRLGSAEDAAGFGEELFDVELAALESGSEVEVDQ